MLLLVRLAIISIRIRNALSFESTLSALEMVLPLFALWVKLSLLSQIQRVIPMMDLDFAMSHTNSTSIPRKLSPASLEHTWLRSINEGEPAWRVSRSRMPGV
jgi:hypothetical protein